MAERVLITGARAAAALDLARDFRSAGFEVHMADCAPARISRWSRSAQRFHSYRSPVRDPEGFRSDLRAATAAIDPAIIVPACEEVFHLAAARDQEDLGAPLFAPDLATLETLHDKSAFAGLCVRLGLPVPKSRRLTNREDLQPYLEEPGQWVFKSCFSRFGTGTLVGPGPSELAKIAPTPKTPWLAQRRVRGRELSFYAVAHGGSLSAFAIYDAQWRLSGGASISFDAVSGAVVDSIAELARTLAQGCAITGQFACDLIIDDAGRPWLLECNPRATSGVHLLAGDGSLARAISRPRTPLLSAGPTRRHLLPAMLTYGLGLAVSQRRFGEWSMQLRHGRDVAGRRGDRLPMLGAIVDGLGFMIAGRRDGTSAAAASTADIEWNGSMSG